MKENVHIHSLASCDITHGFATYFIVVRAERLMKCREKAACGEETGAGAVASEGVAWRLSRWQHRWCLASRNKWAFMPR
jgi:hypothetical protein